MQNTSKPSAPEAKASYSAVARNFAIIVAALAFSYSQLAPHIGSKESKIEAPDPVAATASTEISNSVEPAPQAAAVPPGGLNIGADANAQAFRDFLKAKADEVNKAGHVVFTQDVRPLVSPGIASTTPAQYAAESSPKMPPAASEAVAPARPTNTGSDVSKSEAGGLTTHPAPFVDAQAVASIQEHRDEVAKSGKQAVVKIGMYVDGLPMPESVKREQIRSTLSTIPDEWTITYKAPNEKLRIYAFTDPTCPYCKKLHNALPQLMEAGISVHYLLYPRDMATVQPGQLSVVAKNLKNVWCSVDQVSAMNEAFAGYKVPEADCATLPKSLNRLPAPVPDHYNLGEMFDVTGTPTLMASNGKSQPGFGTAQQIIQDFLD